LIYFIDQTLRLLLKREAENAKLINENIRSVPRYPLSEGVF